MQCDGERELSDERRVERARAQAPLHLFACDGTYLTSRPRVRHVIISNMLLVATETE